MRRRTRGGLGVGSAAKLIVKMKRSRKRAQKRILAREECAVCLNPLGDSETEIKTLGCGHRFHKECINRSIAFGNRTCPLCRRPIPGAAERRAPANPVRDLAQDVRLMSGVQLERLFEELNRRNAAEIPIVTEELFRRENIGQHIAQEIDESRIQSRVRPNALANLSYESTVREFLVGINAPGRDELLFSIRGYVPRLNTMTDDQILDLQLYRDVIRLTHNFFEHWDFIA